MAVFKCKACGGMLEAQNNETVVVCRTCGAANQVPNWGGEPAQAPAQAPVQAPVQEAPAQNAAPQNPYMNQGMAPQQNPYMNQGMAPQNPYMNQGMAPQQNPYMNQGMAPQNPYMAPQAPIDPEQLLKEGFEALELGDGRKAFELFNRVHFADPRNTEAALGKLMLELRVTNKDSISTANVAFDNSPNFQIIMSGNDEELKNKLMLDLGVIRERIAKAAEEAQREAAYVSACQLMAAPTSANFEKAIHIFESILGYKDASERLEACAGQIEGLRHREAAERAEKARREEAARAKAAKTKKKIALILGITVPVIALAVTFFILLFTVFIPNAKYNDALELYEDGQFMEAYEILKEIPNHKNGTTLAIAINNDVLTQFQNYLAENDCKAAYKVLTEFGYTKDEYPMLEGYKAMGEGRYKDAINLGMPEILVQKGTKEITAEQFAGITVKKGFMVTLPEGLTTISDGCFEGSDLVSITLPGSLTTIGAKAFKDCDSLVNITIPDSVTTIGESAFAGSSVKTVTLSAGITSIEKETFKGTTKLESLTIPTSVTTIGEGAFAESAITTISLPSGIKTIEKEAFAYCTKLASVSIPNGVTTLGVESFKGCTALKSVKIPGTITAVPNNAFNGCAKLATVTLESGVKSVGEAAFSGCKALSDLTIPSTVTSLGYAAFYDCDGLTSIQLPNSITELGKEVFRDCDGLRSVTIPSSIKTIPQNAFTSCGALTTINFGTGVTTIAKEAFSSCASLATVVIPSNIKTIEEKAFADCSALSSFTIPTSVTKLGTSVFSGSKKLTYISYLGTSTQWSAISKTGWNTGAFEGILVYSTDGYAKV